MPANPAPWRRCAEGFAIVTFASALGTWYQEIVDHVGLGARCSGIHSLAEPFADIGAVAEEKAAKLVALRPRKATAGGFRHPAAKPMTGLPPALARLYYGSAP